MAWQVEQLNKLVRDEKWLGSEKAGHDIGTQQTETEIIMNGLYNKMATKWREEYCGTICRYSWSCEVWSEMKKNDR